MKSLLTLFGASALSLFGADALAQVNTAPVANTDSFNFVVNSAVQTLHVLGNDTDAEGEALQIVSVSPQGNRGSVLQIAPDGKSIQYTPAVMLRDPNLPATPDNLLGFSEQFSYRVADASGKESRGAVVRILNSSAAVDFRLNLVHAADMEGAGNAIEDAPNFSAVLDALRNRDPASTLVLSSGDNYIPGPFFSASSDPSLVPLIGGVGNGSADVQMLNAMGFQASAMGNHEFDEGTARIKALIETRTVDANGDGMPDTYPGQNFPYLTTNLNFAADANLAPFVVVPRQAPLPRTITRSAVFNVNGQTIGVLGATTPTLPTISSPGTGVVTTPQPFAGTPTPEQLDALAAIIQTEVDALLATGLNKVILLAHMQVLNIERQLATRLRGVDIIIAGGSDSILADGNDRLRAGDTAVDTYPILTSGADGAPLAIVNTDGQYRYVGRLNAVFNLRGLLLTDRINPNISGAYATDASGVAAVGGTVNPQVQNIVDAIENVLITREGNILGRTGVFINGARSGLRGNGQTFGGVRTEETNLGNLSADANIFEGRKADPSVVASLKNGGGIRNVIGRVEQPAGSTDPLQAQLLPTGAIPAAGKDEGDLSQFDVQNALSFNNGLTLVTVNGVELKDALEHGLSGSIAAANGRFPQIGGIRLSYDETKTSRTAVGNGNRLCSLIVETQSGDVPVVSNGALVSGANLLNFRMVTLTFLVTPSAPGSMVAGDGYPLVNLAAANRVDLVGSALLGPGSATFAASGSEQDALAEHLLANFSSTPFNQADTVAGSDTRIVRTSCP